MNALKAVLVALGIALAALGVELPPGLDELLGEGAA